MAKLLIISNADSRNTQLICDNRYVQDNFAIDIINNLDITGVTPDGIVTVGKTIAIDDVDALWLEFDWDLENPDRTSQHFTKLLYTYHGEKFVYNLKTLQLFHPFYDSKIFNAAFLSYHDLPHPRTKKLTGESDLRGMPFPQVLKKDMSGRARDVKIVASPKDLTTEQASSGQYVLQELLAIAEEFRVVVFEGRVLGAVIKSTKFNGLNDQKVRVVGKAERLAPAVGTACEQLAQHLQADLVGIDAAVDRHGNPWIIEFNIGATLEGFMRETEIDVIAMLFERFSNEKSQAND